MLKRVLLICLLMLFVSSCFEDCNNPNAPDIPETKDVAVEVKYARADDTPLCPVINPEDNRVYLNGFRLGTNNGMDKVGEEIFFKKVPRVVVGNLYTIFVLDYAFFTDLAHEDHIKRAHLIYLNGYLITKVHRNNTQAEWIVVRFDENGVPHEE